MKMMDIGEVATRAGVQPSTLRYYEEIGLIRSEGRHGLRRQFDSDVLLRLSLIALGRTAGFSLTEIAAILRPNGRLELPRERGPIAVLIDDHRRMSSQLATIERLLAGDLTTGDSRAALSRAVDAYVTSLAHHIDAENSVLLPESEGRLLKRNIRELPSRQPTPDESAARDLGHRLVARYPPSRRDTIMRGDGCVLCPAMGESCAGLELEWWNEWEWEEAEDHLPSG